jgi:hypothetical protein
MAIKEKDIKRLWGFAAGRCSRPGCDESCIRFLPSDPTVIGEMAHIIAHSPIGPRGSANEPKTGAHGLRSPTKRHAVSLVAFGTTVRTEALRKTFCESPTAPQMGQWGNVHRASVKVAAAEAHRQ